ncbi:hypothetical protein AB6M97_01995 [Streptococcus hillyeri]|uniref:hypothetical protein n=1 Tax=Streptococcus hillyeri TaxID=2282420 RepID=UPI0034E1A80A
MNFDGIRIYNNTETCLAKIGTSWEKVEFYGIFQKAGTDMGFGNPFAYPVAVVKFNGKLYEIITDNVDFEGENHEQTH